MINVVLSFEPVELRVRSIDPIRNKNTWSDELKRYVWRFEATRIINICLKL